MTFDLQKYRSEHQDRYGDAPLDAVAEDLYWTYNMDKKHSSPQEFFKSLGWDKQLEAARKQQIKDNVPRTLVGEFTRGLGMGTRGVKEGYHGSRALLSGDEGERQERLGKVRELHEATERKPISVPEFTDIVRRDEDTDKVDFGESFARASRWAAGQLGALVPIVGSIMAGGIAGGIAGAKFGPKGAAAGAMGGVLKAGWATVAGSSIGSFTVGYGLYGGSMYSDLRERGAGHGDARKASLIYAAPASAVSIVVPLATLGAITGYLGKDFVKNRAKAALLGAGLSTPAEGIAEGIAESFVIAGEESVFGVTLTPEEKRHRIINAAAAGALMGTAMGAFGGAGRKQGSIDDMMNAFQADLEQSTGSVSNESVLSVAVAMLEGSRDLSPQQAQLLDYLKSGEAKNNRPLNSQLKKINRATEKVFARSYEENEAIANELARKHDEGTMTGDEALELTSILTNISMLRKSHEASTEHEAPKDVTTETDPEKLLTEGDQAADPETILTDEATEPAEQTLELTGEEPGVADLVAYDSKKEAQANANAMTRQGQPHEVYKADDGWKVRPVQKKKKKPESVKPKPVEEKAPEPEADPFVNKFAKIGDVTGKIVEHKDGRYIFETEKGHRYPVDPTDENVQIGDKPFEKKKAHPDIGKHVLSGTATGKVVEVKEDGSYVLDTGSVVTPKAAPNWQIQDKPFEEKAKEPEAAKEDETAKQPWQVTQEEFAATGKPPVTDARKAELHESHVKLAIEEGQTVPPEVLQDYPHLAKTAEAKEPKKVPRDIKTIDGEIKGAREELAKLRGPAMDMAYEIAVNDRGAKIRQVEKQIEQATKKYNELIAEKARAEKPAEKTPKSRASPPGQSSVLPTLLKRPILLRAGGW